MTGYGTLPASSGATATAPSGGFFSRARETGQALYAQRRPWMELIQITSFNKPDSFPDAMLRVRKNFSYFRVNYALLILGIVFLALLWHPVSLIVLLAMFVLWGFLYFFRDEPLVVFGRTLSEGLVIVLMSILTFIALLLTKATMAFLIGLLVAVVLVLLHSVLRHPEDFYLNDDEEGGGSLIPVVDRD